MTTALTGLQAAETTIDVVGNNVANSNTVGFKESNVLFATQFLQTQSIGSAPSDSRGGTNPRQIGLGVKAAAINPDFTQGTIEISANPLDVAIQGDGFLIVEGGQGETLFTRNGQLQTNANNEIVTVTGNRILGFGVDDDYNIVETDFDSMVSLRIPVGEEIVAQATQTAILTGRLSPNAEVADQPAVILSQVLGDDTLEIPNDPGFDSNDFQVLNAGNVSGSTTALAGAGTVPAGNSYDYRIVFYKNTGSLPTVYEGPPSVTFGAISVPAGPNQNIDLTGLPTDGTGAWDGRRIYRRQGSGNFELVGAIADTTTTTFTDTAAAGGAVLDSTELNQSNYSYYVTFYSTVNGDESRPTPQIAALNVSGTNRRIRIDNIPQPTSAAFDAVRIYRNLGGTSDFRLVTTLQNGETTYIDGATDSAISGNSQIDLMGPKASEGTLLVDLVTRNGETYQTPFAIAATGGVLSFEGAKGGSRLAAKELAIDSTTTLGDLIDFMDEAFGVQDPTDDPFSVTAGKQPMLNGQIQFISNMGTANALSVPLTAFQLTPTGSNSTTPITIGFTETQPAVGAGSSSNFVVYDSLGIPVRVRITTALESKDGVGDATTYRWFATSADNEPTPPSVDTFIGTGTITFDGTGKVISGGTPTIGIERNVTASQSPLAFTLDFTRVSGLDSETSQLNLSQQDGFAPGSLASFLITESGLIRGVFTNGTERPLGQIRMVRFANNTGLQQLGENLFAEGVNSGEPIDGNPGDSGIGGLTAGAVELSNTDIGQNLIELILASTQYRGGTRVITSAQQLLDELLSLRR
jgi:flagellar hook protein FlgE